MKIALAQLNYIVGDFSGNLEKIIDNISMARQQGADLIVFAELAVCGYPPEDLLEYRSFLQASEDAIRSLKLHSGDIGIIIGAPSLNHQRGKAYFNSAFFISEGEVKEIVHKALLPEYDVLEEPRYFAPGRDFKVIEFRGKRIALTVCEDMWNIGNENPLYDVCPMDMLIEQRPDFAVNISAVNFYIGKASLRKKVITSNAVKYKIPFFTVNHIGAQTGLIFDGGSSVASPDGLIFREMPCFEEALEVFDLDEVIKGNHEDEVVMGEIELIHKALIVGIQDYFKKQNLSSAILGLSGGLDSAVVAALATEALGKENVRGLLMPSQYSSSHSLEDAISLAQNLGIRFDIVPIKDIFDQYIFTLQPLFVGMSENVTEENLQARIRAMLLMAVSNKYGNILLNTSNKSEVAVGYGTLYGDVCGAISVLGDVYKTEVYRLAHFINRDRIIVPLNTINKAPSAELRPGQKDSDSLPPYEVLDQILYEHIENGKGSTEIVELGFDAQMVENILRKVKFNEFKRRQAPPVLRVSRKAFGLGRKMPIVNGFSM